MESFKSGFWFAIGMCLGGFVIYLIVKGIQLIFRAITGKRKKR